MVTKCLVIKVSDLLFRVKFFFSLISSYLIQVGGIVPSDSYQPALPDMENLWRKKEEVIIVVEQKNVYNILLGPYNKEGFELETGEAEAYLILKYNGEIIRYLSMHTSVKTLQDTYQEFLVRYVFNSLPYTL